MPSIYVTEDQRNKIRAISRREEVKKNQVIDLLTELYRKHKIQEEEEIPKYL